MCGLALCISRRGKHTGQRVFDLYKHQEARGKKGFGFISIEDGKINQIFRAREEYELKTALLKDSSHIILMHHRYPTSTENVLGATHPIFVSNDELEYDYYIAHNGVIGNSNVLKLQHNKLGYQYTTEHTEVRKAVFTDGREEIIQGDKPIFNDSESLAIELARFIENKSDKVDIIGSAAFWGITVKKGSNDVINMFLGKNMGRDLKVLDTTKWYIVSSQTGQDLEDMKLWTMGIKDEEWSVRDLVTDKNEPKKPTQITIGYGRDYDDDYRYLPAKFPNANRDTQQRLLLKNAFYTTLERDETGLPPAEFFATTFNGKLMWVPQKYTGYNVSRGVFSNEVDQPDQKVLDRLEDLCMEYAKLGKKYEQIESYMEKGFYKDDERKNQAIEEMDGIDRSKQLIEENISALGVDDKIMEETLDTCEGIINYEESIPSPYELLD